MATAQSFVIDLTDLLDVPRPHVSDKDGDFLDNRFERPVIETHTGRKKNRRIDLYKKGPFVLEAKQFVSKGGPDKDTLEMFLAKDTPKQTGHGTRGTAKFDDTMMKARNQADNYARAVAREDGWPPFLMIVDVGHVIELYADFSGQGHDSETVAPFLMCCLFSMFAEDVDLIPRESFTNLLKKLRAHPEHAQPSLQGLWETMNKGGFSQVLMHDLKRFNGGLFKEADALPLNALQLGLLIEAAEADWQQVEPAIFGTLLERALDKRQRHKLGAHYTPRAYVERLATPTIMEPLREDWRDVQTAVQRLSADGKDAQARKLVAEFHARLCEICMLDPACGPGNFLYVALEMMKRLEGEVTSLLDELGETQASFITVDPHQFLGIELNPCAANVAELVLWIGYLQWHCRTHGQAAPSEPVLRDFKNIRQGDAVLEWAGRTPRTNADGAPVTRWDGITTIRHNVTGEEVPDACARIAVYDYAKPKATKWPEAEFIVGNPPFIGASRLRDSLGDGYVEALWKAYPKMPQSADLVMFWWEKAALAARAWNAKTGKGTRRFGLITTNSLRMTFNRRVVEQHLNDPKRYVATVVTAKHRFFTFVDGQILPDDALNAIALDEAAFLSVLSSRLHRVWAGANSSSIGMYKGDVRYLKTRCFDPFPFPDLTDAQRTHLRQLGEDLDAHRKRRQAEHPKLTLTQMYNVLEKLRAGEGIEGKDKDIYDQGLIGILRDLHDQIDAAVADAYGWPADLSDEDILLRLVALNKERAEEEARGLVRWLRPDYQNPTGAQAAKGKTADMDLGVVAKIEKAPWPKTLPDQIAAVREALSEMGEATPEQIARRFVRGQARTVEPLMQSLAALGQAEMGEDGRYAA